MRTEANRSPGHIGPFDDAGRTYSKIAESSQFAGVFIHLVQDVIALSHEETSSLQAICKDVATLPRGAVLTQPGQPTETVYLMLRGFAIRRMYSVNGRRPIVGIVLPGDFCDLGCCLLQYRDHAVHTLSNTMVGRFSRSDLQNLIARYPHVARGLWHLTLHEESRTRQWLINLAQRSASERLAHFFCDTFDRARSRQLVSGMSCELPMSQSDLGDALALSAVHVNRVLRGLVEHGLVTFCRRQLTIRDEVGLRDAAGRRG